MAVHPNFQDWYRSAAITPPEGLVEKRWAGVEAVAKQPKSILILSLARLFALANATESTVPQGFRDSFRAHDSGFASKDNLQELRVLAGATLRFLIEQRHSSSTLAALALVCGSFGPRELTLPEREHLDVAERFLLDASRTVRESPMPAAVKIPALTKKRFAELLQQGFFSPNQTQQLYEPLLNVLAEMGSAVSSALKASDQLTHAVKVREEELNILWWLQTQFSRDLRKPFSELGYVAGTLIFPMEIGDLTMFVPGSESAVAVLVYALRLAGAPSSSETITIANATNTTPREWREKVRGEQDLSSTGLLCPILLGIQKSLETDGRDDWLPVYRKACDIPVDRPFPLMQLAVQLFRERMLLRALAEVE